MKEGAPSGQHGIGRSVGGEDVRRASNRKTVPNSHEDNWLQGGQPEARSALSSKESAKKPRGCRNARRASFSQEGSELLRGR